jgi:hypothetical protein
MTPSERLRAKPLVDIFILSAVLSLLSGCAAAVRPATPSPVPTRGSASLYLPGQSAPQLVHFAVVEGVAVMGGDIVLGPVETLTERYGPPRAAVAAGDHVSSAFAIERTKNLWPGGVIPYTVDASVSPSLRKEILLAIEDVNRTRLSMRPMVPLDQDYVVFNAKNHAGVCDSYLGRTGGPQPIRVNGCGRSTVVHEILHAAGFDHEHQRPDRDAHVSILWDNIDPAHHVNFERVEKNRVVLGPYDYKSVMHYRTTAFSRNGKPTIVPHVPNTQIRDFPSLSPGDVAAIDRLYADAAPSLPLPPIAGLPAIPGLGDLSLPGWPLPQLPVALPPELFGGSMPQPPAGWPDLGSLLR